MPLQKHFCATFAVSNNLHSALTNNHKWKERGEIKSKFLRVLWYTSKCYRLLENNGSWDLLLCIGFDWILRCGCWANEHELEGFKWTELFLPYVYNSIFVLVVIRPYRYFVSLCSDVDDSTTNIITVVIKRFSHKAQKLKNKTRI